MTDKVATRLSAFDFADRVIFGGVKAYLSRRRHEGLTDVQIVDHLATEHGIEVTDEAVRQWRKAQGVS
jgi:hypothetical protein